MLDKKTILVTGGTGSFGNAVVRRLLAGSVAEIRIFSLDEKKQDDMRKRYRDRRLKFYRGDVRHRDSVAAACTGVDYIFHAAALKQVPSCEFHPMEAVRTNVQGTDNVLTAAIAAGVSRVICLSTDKAVYPINAMGMSKALMEKVAIAKSRESSSTVICVTRYGNVMASRGSVIPLFVDQIRTGEPLTITDPEMTRFMMTLDDAVDLVLYAFEHGGAGDVFVQKAPAATVEILAEALKRVMKVPQHPVEIMGTRHGEKLYEVLLSREEMASAEDLGGYFRVQPDQRDLNYEMYVEKGEERITKTTEYNSHNTTRLDTAAMAELLMKVRYVRDTAEGVVTHPED